MMYVIVTESSIVVILVAVLLWLSLPLATMSPLDLKYITILKMMARFVGITRQRGMTLIKRLLMTTLTWTALTTPVGTHRL